MARVQKKEVEKKKLTKGEMVLQIVVLSLLVAIVVFAIILIVKLFEDETTNSNPYEDYVLVGTDDLRKIIEINLDISGLDYNDLDSSAVKELLLSDANKTIAIVFFSTFTSEYGDNAENIHNKLVSAVTKNDSGKNGTLLILLCDYSKDPSILTSVVDETLRANGVNITYPSTYNVPSLLRILPNASPTERFRFANKWENVVSLLTPKTT